MNISQYRQIVRNGPYSWPGGYPLYAITSDGAALCFNCLKKERRNILEALSTDMHNGWLVQAVDANYEDPELFCDHCGKRIESAYADD